MNFPEIYSATGMMELIQKIGFLPLPFLSSFPILIFHLPVFLICPSFSFQYPFFTFLPLKKPFYFFTFLPLKTLFTFKRAFF